MSWLRRFCARKKNFRVFFLFCINFRRSSTLMAKFIWLSIVRMLFPIVLRYYWKSWRDRMLLCQIFPLFSKILAFSFSKYSYLRWTADWSVEGAHYSNPKIPKRCSRNWPKYLMLFVLVGPHVRKWIFSIFGTSLC